MYWPNFLVAPVMMAPLSILQDYSPGTPGLNNRETAGWGGYPCTSASHPWCLDAGLALPKDASPFKMVGGVTPGSLSNRETP